MNMPALAVACEMACSTPAATAPSYTPASVKRHREHQEQVADLRHRRIGHQQLQPLLAQRDHAADDDGRGAQAAQQLRRRRAGDAGHDVAPQPQHQEPRALDDQRRQHRAGRGRRAAVRRRQPDVQREQRGLGEQAHRHQRQRGPGDRARLRRPRPAAGCPACRSRRTAAPRPAGTAPSRTARTAGSAARRAASRRCRPGTPAARRRRSAVPARHTA